MTWEPILSQIEPTFFPFWAKVVICAMIQHNFAEAANVIEPNSRFHQHESEDRSSGVQHGHSSKGACNRKGADPYLGTGSVKGYVWGERVRGWWPLSVRDRHGLMNGSVYVLCNHTKRWGRPWGRETKYRSVAGGGLEEGGAQTKQASEGLSALPRWWQGPKTLADVYGVLQIEIIQGFVNGSSPTRADCRSRLARAVKRGDEGHDLGKDIVIM